MNIEQIKEALSIGLDAAQERASNVHQKLAGYHPEEHDEVDLDVRKIKIAIVALNDSTQEPVGYKITAPDGNTCVLEAPFDVTYFREKMHHKVDPLFFYPSLRKIHENEILRIACPYLRVNAEFDFQGFARAILAAAQEQP